MITAAIGAIEKITKHILLAVFLFRSTALYPVSTGWVARTLFAPAPATVFATLNLFETLSFVVLEHSIISSHDCLMIKNAVRKSKKEIVTLALEAAAVAVSFIPQIRLGSYILLLIMSVLWIVPDLRMKRVYQNTNQT